MSYSFSNVYSEYAAEKCSFAVYEGIRKKFIIEAGQAQGGVPVPKMAAKPW